MMQFNALLPLRILAQTILLLVVHIFKKDEQLYVVVHSSRCGIVLFTGGSGGWPWSEV